MSAELEPDLQLEIAHVLFIDVVGYSKLLINEQHQRVAEDLGQYRHWQALLHDLGQCAVKHGEVISLVNVYNDELGNPLPPTKIQCHLETSVVANPTKVIPARRGRIALAFLALTLALLAMGSWFYFHRASVQSNSTAGASNSFNNAPVAEKSIAVLPFENLSTNHETGF